MHFYQCVTNICRQNDTPTPLLLAFDLPLFATYGLIFFVVSKIIPIFAKKIDLYYA